MTSRTCRVVFSRRDVEPTAGHRLARNPTFESQRQNAGPAVTNPKEHSIE